MTQNDKKVTILLDQIGRVTEALDDVKRNILPKNPDLFATLAEGYVEELNRLTNEIRKYLIGAKTAG